MFINLLKILGWMTGKPRRQVYVGVDFNWSDKSWTHNIFRTLELVFGAKEGISISAVTTASKIGSQVTITREFYTIEALLAYVEGLIRGVRFKIVPIQIPVFVPAFPSGFAPRNLKPIYSFAIALDTSTSGSTASATSLAYNHTTTGSNTILVGGGFVNTDSDVITALTYNSVAVTRAQTIFTAAVLNVITIGTLVAPTTGSNSYSMTWTGTLSANSAVATYTGAAQTGQPDHSTNNKSAAATSIATTLVTTADNCWGVVWARAENAGIAASTNETERQSVGAGGNLLADSNAAITPAGSFVQTTTCTLGAIGQVAVAIAPAMDTFIPKIMTS